MNPLTIFSGKYGLTHTELAQLTGRHRTCLTKMLTFERAVDNQTLAVCYAILEKVGHATEETRQATPAPIPIDEPEWVAQEKLKLSVWQKQLTRLLDRLEQLQKQNGFWTALCHCGIELACSTEWLKRHQEEKKATLQRCWLHDYLPMLTRVRQSEARIAAWEEACLFTCI